MHVQVLVVARRGYQTPGAGVTSVWLWAPWCGCWELNSALLEEQPSALEPLCRLFNSLPWWLLGCDLGKSSEPHGLLCNDSRGRIAVQWPESSFLRWDQHWLCALWVVTTVLRLCLCGYCITRSQEAAEKQVCWQGPGSCCCPCGFPCSRVTKRQCRGGFWYWLCVSKCVCVYACARVRTRT